jgi:DNA replication and repair protein RecF
VHVSDLALTDFRSYRDLVVSFPPGTSVLVGPNGQGKTNLVEAVAYLATFSSHRVAGDAALVREGAERAVIRCRAVRGERSAVVELEIVAGRANRARLNRAAVSRARDVLGIVRAVLFAPEDLAMVKGEPEGRRRFLDDLLVMRVPRLAAVRAGYDRTLRQRGALLRSLGGAGRSARGSAEVRSTLDVWDGQLAAAGAELVAARRALVLELGPHVARAYETVSGGDGAASLTYRASTDAHERSDPGTDGPAASTIATSTAESSTDVPAIEAELLEAMTRLRSKEIERGVCLVGPHRDDLLLAIGALPARGYASHGESWSLALALRLASYDLLRADTSGEWSEGGEPVLILDDVFAELDARRRGRLAGMVAGADQVLVTAAAVEDVPESLVGARYDVRDGAVARVR